MKRLWMTGCRSQLPPFGGHIAVCPFHQIQYILYVFIHLPEGNTTLLTCAARTRILARHTGRNHGQGLRSDVFTELEIFMVAQPYTLVITPEISLRLAGFQRPYGGLPPV